MELKLYRDKWAVYWRDPGSGRPVRRSLGTSDGEVAKQRFAEFKRSLELKRTDRGYTLQNLWDLRKAALEGRRLGANMEWSGRSILPVLGFLGPSQLQQSHIDDYTSKRKAAQGTKWTELNHLRMTLTWAAKVGLIEKAPYFALPSRPPPKTDYLTKAQAKEFLGLCTFPHIKLFVLLALSTGGRNQALLDLTWSANVNLDKRFIDLRQADMETKKGRALVPINDTLHAALVEAKGFARCDFVIEYGGHRVGSVKKGLKAVAARMSLDFPVSPHVFRHSSAVWMAEAGVDMEEIAQFLGHSDINVTRRTYARFSPTYLRKAAQALEF